MLTTVKISLCFKRLQDDRPYPLDTTIAHSEHCSHSRENWNLDDDKGTTKMTTSASIFCHLSELLLLFNPSEKNKLYKLSTNNRNWHDNHFENGYDRSPNNYKIFNCKIQSHITRIVCNTQTRLVRWCSKWFLFVSIWYHLVFPDFTLSAGYYLQSYKYKLLFRIFVLDISSDDDDDDGDDD